MPPNDRDIDIFLTILSINHNSVITVTDVHFVIG